MPFPDARIIPTGWSAHHRPAMKTAMNATVTIGRNAGATHSDLTDDTTTTWDTVHAGPARVQQLGGTAPTNAAGQALTGHAYLVQVEHPAPDVAPGMRVHVTAAANDPDLADAVLWVVDRMRGSEAWTRDLMCSDSLTDVPH